MAGLWGKRRREEQEAQDAADAGGWRIRSSPYVTTARMPRAGDIRFVLPRPPAASAPPAPRRRSLSHPEPTPGCDRDDRTEPRHRAGTAESQAAIELLGQPATATRPHGDEPHGTEPRRVA